MKAIGIILIIAGICLFIFTKIRSQNQEKAKDVAMAAINETENKITNLRAYAGGVAAVAGMIVLFSNKKKII